MAKPGHRPDAASRPWPVLTGDAQTDSAVWHLSLVLREIAESRASDASDGVLLTCAATEDTSTDGQKNNCHGPNCNS
jgi:hypothetical protein